MTSVASGWYVIYPDGGAWVAVELDRSGRMVDLIEEANVETHLAARDRLAFVCEALRGEQFDASVTAEQADAVVRAWSPDADPECCVVERVVGVYSAGER